jgi:hypothetical protein
VFSRGDTDCSIGLTAAHVVAQLEALGGVTLCENDDCDRDGAMTWIAPPAVCSAAARFRRAGNLAAMFERSNGSTAVHPDAAIVCIGGTPQRPTAVWNEDWAAAVLTSPPVNRVLFLPRKPTSPVLFDLRGGLPITPPVTYGDTSRGEDVGPYASSPPDLEPGVPYGVTIASSRVTLSFELR